MPELPEFEVVREVLLRRVIGQRIAQVHVIPPGGAIVVRDLTHTGFAHTLADKAINNVMRRGKFLVLSLGEDGLHLVINPKLTGRLQLAQPSDKRMAKTHIVLRLSGGAELRYVDMKQMGQVYLTRDIQAVPDFAGMGPEPFDLTLEQFRALLKPFRGEIKGVLTRNDAIAGIGNAYADEILWAAKLHPYRKRTSLSDDEIARLYSAIQSTLREAIEKVRAEMGEQIHLKPRDFMAVHMQNNQPCPRCGTLVSQVSANQRITNFCRTCQPGGLIKN